MQPDQQQPQSKQLPMKLTTNDMVGAIRQMLLELMGVINQPVHQIDPVLVNAYLIRMLEFNDVLPPLEQQERRQ